MSNLIFYKLITPYWLRDNAKLGFSIGSAEVTETRFHVPKDVRKYESLFQMQLLGPKVLVDDDDIVIKLKVGVEYPGPQPKPSPPPRRDPMIFVIWCPRNDDSMGIQINDYQQYQTDGIGPCRGAEGEATERGLRDITFLEGRKTQDWYRFSEMFELTFCPNSSGNIPWSSAHCGVDSGTYDAFGPYYKSLRLSEGINLGIYRDEKEEVYIIKSLEISIFRNSKDVHGK